MDKSSSKRDLSGPVGINSVKVDKATQTEPELLDPPDYENFYDKLDEFADAHNAWYETYHDESQRLTQNWHQHNRRYMRLKRRLDEEALPSPVADTSAGVLDIDNSTQLQRVAELIEQDSLRLEAQAAIRDLLSSFDEHMAATQSAALELAKKEGATEATMFKDFEAESLELLKRHDRAKHNLGVMFQESTAPGS